MTQPHDPSNVPPPPPPVEHPPTVNYGSASTGEPGGLFSAPPPPPFAVRPEERTWGMLCHLTALSGLIGVPFGSILGPLIIWLIKKDEMPFVNDQGKESLNFHISLIIIAICLTPTICLAGIGIILLIGLGVFALVMIIIASVKANQGVAYRSPFAMGLMT